MRKSSDPTEKPAGDVICLGGVVHAYHSGEGDRWARLCMVVTAPAGGRARADVLLSPEQAGRVASAMEKGSDFSCAASLGMLWCWRSGDPALATLRAECAFGNGGKEVCVTDMHLRQIAAALRAASSPRPAARRAASGAGRTTT